MCVWLAPGPFTSVSQAADRPNLYVFLQTDVKATVFEKTMQARLPALNVRVFGRFRDFDEALTHDSPQALLTLLPLLEARNLEPTIRGLSAGQDTEDYVLVSVGAPLDGSLSNRLIGVVDLLGRKDTQAFVAALLKTNDVRTKLVTKLEDLLSLLQFGASDAILVPIGAVKSISERSKLSLVVRPLPDARVGRPAVSVLSPAARSIVVEQIKALDAATNQMIGVDQWRSK
jgi:hypothetical protein